MKRYYHLSKNPVTPSNKAISKSYISEILISLSILHLSKVYPMLVNKITFFALKIPDFSRESYFLVNKLLLSLFLAIPKAHDKLTKCFKYIYKIYESWRFCMPVKISIQILVKSDLEQIGGFL